MLDPIFYCNFHSGCIICCIDIPYAYIQKISFFAYFGVYVRLKSVRIWEFPGLNFWAPSWKWFLKDISFRKQHQKSSIYKCTNRPFLCISCLTILLYLKLCIEAVLVSTLWIFIKVFTDAVYLRSENSFVARGCSVENCWMMLLMWKMLINIHATFSAFLHSSRCETIQQ